MLPRCDKCTTYSLKALPSDADTYKNEQHVIQHTACDNEKIDNCLQASEHQKTVATFDLQQILQYPKVKGAKQSFSQIRNGAIQLVFLC